MNRLEKILKKELNDNEEAVQSVLECYHSSFESFIKDQEKDIATSEADIQKILSDIANANPDDVIEKIYERFIVKEGAANAIEKLNMLRAYMFEEIEERKVVHGLKKKQ